MSSKNSRTHGSPETSRRPDANAPTRLFAVPPRLSESRASASCPSGALPSSEGATQNRARKLPPPRRARPATPTIEVNEPMLVYLDSPPRRGAGDARPAHAALRPKTTDTAPSVAPVPIIAITQHRSPGSSPARPLAAELLRAYDQQRRRPANWTTAKTIDSSLTPFAMPNGIGSRAVGQDEPVRTAPESRPASPQRPLSRLRPSRVATKKILAVFVAAAVLVALGTVAGQTIAKVVSDRASSVVASNVAASNVTASNVAASSAETTQASPDGTPRTFDDPVEHATPSRHLAAAAPRISAPSGGTLARQAVDALLAGDRARALLLYRELSRKAPAREDYRKAVRLLTPPPPAPGRSTHTDSPIVP